MLKMLYWDKHSNLFPELQRQRKISRRGLTPRLKLLLVLTQNDPEPDMVNPDLTGVINSGLLRTGEHSLE